MNWKNKKKKQLVPQLKKYQKDIKSFFRLEKENQAIKDRILRDIRNVFRLQKENNAIKGIILRDIRNIFENEEEENYYKPVKISSK